MKDQEKTAFSGTSSDVSVFTVEVDIAVCLIHCSGKGKIFI